MDGDDLHRPPGRLAVRFLRQFDEAAAGIRLPAGIAADAARLETSERQVGVESIDLRALRAVDAGAVEQRDDHGIVAGVDHAQVGRGLHQPRDVGAHLGHAVRERGQRADERPRLARRDDARGERRGVDGAEEAGIEASQRCARLRLHLRHRFLYAGQAGRVDDGQRRGLARDRVALVPALQRGDVDAEVALQSQQHPREQPDRVAAAPRDVDAAVPAAQAVHLDANARAAGGGGRPRRPECGDGVDPAGTADRQPAFPLAVEVHEIAAGEHARGKRIGALEPGLFVDGHQHFERPVREVARSERRQRRGDADAVVGAERRARRAQQVAVTPRHDGVALEVVGGALVLLAHHVDVRLQHHADRRLATGGRALADHDVADAVAQHFAAQPPALRRDPVGGSGFVPDPRGIWQRSKKYCQSSFGSSVAASGWLIRCPSPGNRRRHWRTRRDGAGGAPLCLGNVRSDHSAHCDPPNGPLCAPEVAGSASLHCSKYRSDRRPRPTGPIRRPG